MLVVHLMASPFVGGPERQVLGLARHMTADCRTVFLSFAERGLAEPFLAKAAGDGFQAIRLAENAPHFLRAAAEVADWLRTLGADLLCTSGYKPDLIGWLAARRVGVPVAAIAHGWTSATWKVRCYEQLDRWAMRRMDAVVCVSEGQAVKVRRAGVTPERAAVIRNAIDADAFPGADSAVRESLLALFPVRPRRLIAAAGRLSREKGFDVLIDAASRLAPAWPDAGFVLFGDGPLREDLTRRIAERGLSDRFVLAGFRLDLERLLPACDLAVSSSHTEGLPVVVLEEMAAALPVVATAVGGTPEVVE
ncbi:MAG TPA: glycosyltransferase, partial [Gemmataceae bacterium]|nr:glycosyltransferase [Gemmataceae bacterium]